MTQRTFLDYTGLKRFLSRLKAIIPTKTSELQNDSGYLTQHNPVDSSLSDTSENAVQNKVVKDALDGKSDTGHTHTASEVSGLSAVATSGSYNDLSNTPTIPTVNNATLTIQKNGSTVKTFTANASSNVTANITVPTAVSELTNDSGYLTSASNLDSSKLTGTIDIARLPKGALERLVTVANQTARFALTTSDVQLGDTVKQLDTGVMYIVTDETKLSSADGYTEYTAGSATSVPWSGVTGKPSSFTPSSHTHGNVTNDGKLPTASRALISDSSKNITVSSVTDTELGYLSGVTSSVQTQLNGKSASNHVHGSITNDGKLGTASRALVTDSSKKIAVSTVTATELGYVSGVTSAIQTQLNGKSASNHVHGNITNDGKVGTTANKPLITGTGGVVQAGSFGTAANTFCEGNDSRLSDARTPVAHTHVTADVTDLLSNTHTWTSQQSYNSDLNLNYANTDVDDIVNSVAGSATLDNFVHMTGNETVNGIKSFPDGVIANVTGSATSATQDGSGNVISTTYGKLGANNTWSGTNYYNRLISFLSDFSIGTSPSADKSGGFNFTNGTSTIGLVSTNQLTTGTTYILQQAGNKFTNGVLDPNGTWKTANFQVGVRANGDRFVYTDGTWRSNLTPYVDPGESESYMSLGTSTNQWYNLYAKNYYYNGTPWGLDKINVWSNNQVFEGFNGGRTLSLRRAYLALGDPPPASGFTEIGTYTFCDKNNANFGFMNLRDHANGNTALTLLCRQRYTDGVRDTSGDYKEAAIILEVDSSTNPNVYPGGTGTHNLGTSSRKWKSFNGVNPGALSLPQSASVNIDTTNWNLRGGTICTITPSVDTYICVQISRNVEFGLWAIGTGRQNSKAVLTSNDGYYRAMIMFPCAAGNSVNFYTQPLVDTPEENRDPDLIVEYAKYFYCLGNV